MAKRVILRYPDGEDELTTNKVEFMQKFTTWLINCNRFSNHIQDSNGDIFEFPKSSYGVICRIKWRKIIRG